MTPKNDVAALKQPDLKEAYNIEIRNRFSALMGERKRRKHRKPYRNDQLQLELSIRSDTCSSRKGIAKEKTRSKTSMDNRGNTTKK